MHRKPVIEELKQSRMAQSFYYAALEIAPHSKAEIVEEVLRRYPLSGAKSYFQNELNFHYNDRARKIANFQALLKGAGQGKALCAEMPESVEADGEMETRVGQVLRGVNAPALVPFTYGKLVEISYSEGRSEHKGVVRIHPEKLVGPMEFVPNAFSGHIQIAPRLLQRGGLFRTEIEGNVIKVEPLNASVSLFSIALLAVRQNRYLAREVIARLRAGANPSFEIKRGRFSRRGTVAVSIPPASRGRKSALEQFKGRARTYDWIHARFQKAEKSIAEKGKVAATEWLSSPERKIQTAKVNYSEAKSRWLSEADRLFNCWNAVCFKDEKLKQVPKCPPASFPDPKSSASKLDVSRFRNAQYQIVDRWNALKKAEEVMRSIGLPIEETPIEAAAPVGEFALV